MWFPPLLLTATLPAVALLVSGCSEAADVTASVAPLHPSGSPDQVSGRALAAPTEHPQITPRQRAYLDDLAGAGVRRSTDLVALSIGSYICQGRAAGQPEQAVWDFVFPMVHGDLAHLDEHTATTDGGDSSTPVQHRLSARDATATYLRIATERLC